MKKLLSVFLLVSMLIDCFAQNQQSAIISKFIDKLDSLQSFNCLIEYKFANPGNDSMTVTSNNYYFKNPADSLVGYSFSLHCNGDKSIYDGTYLVALVSTPKKYFINNTQIESRLASMFCSPISILRILKILKKGTLQYSLVANKDQDYMLVVEFPYFLMDGYRFDKMSFESKTKVTILFDKQYLLPRNYLKEYINKDGSQSFKTTFKHYGNIAFRSMIAQDSIPSDYQLFNKEEIEKSLLNTRAYNFKLKTLNHDSVELDKINRYVLLEFSTTYCGACRMAIPLLEKIKEKMDGKPLEIYVIDCEDKSNISSLSKLVNKEKISFPYLLDAKETSSFYKISAYPTFFLIDKNKNIIDVLIGCDEERLNIMIDKIK